MSKMGLNEANRILSGLDSLISTGFYPEGMTLGGARSRLAEAVDVLRLGERDAEQKYPLKKEYWNTNWWPASDSEIAVLYRADPECFHEIVYAPGGGIACRRCPGWYCV